MSLDCSAGERATYDLPLLTSNNPDFDMLGSLAAGLGQGLVGSAKGHAVGPALVLPDNIVPASTNQ